MWRSPPIQSFAAILLCFVLLALMLMPVARAEGLSRDAVNQATYSEGWREYKPLIIKVQVLLDRARFSPAAIDGKWGEMTKRAVRAFQQQHGLEATGDLDSETWEKLAGPSGDRDVLKTYQISEHDVKGPFIERVPKDFKEMAELKALSYTGPDELLAEKFHMNIELLRELNPGVAFDSAGETILVTDVRNERHPDFKVARIEVHKKSNSVVALDKQGNVLASYPATIGSAEMPSPSGMHKVTRIVMGPSFTYDPKKLNFPGVHLYRAVKVKPGPNNPVGAVWIALTERGYGIHGTPDPPEIGHTESHGCVRLTNWDAIELAKATRRGIKVEFLN